MRMLFLCYGHRHICIKLCSAVFKRWPMSDLTLVRLWLGHMDSSVDFTAMSAFISGYVAGGVNGFMHLLSQLLLQLWAWSTVLFVVMPQDARIL